MRIRIEVAMDQVFAEQGDSPLYRALGWTQRTGATEVDLDAARAAAPPPDTLPSLERDPPVNYRERWLTAALSRPETPRRVLAFAERRARRKARY